MVLRGIPSLEGSLRDLKLAVDLDKRQLLLPDEDVSLLLADTEEFSDLTCGKRLLMQSGARLVCMAYQASKLSMTTRIFPLTRIVSK